MKKILYTILFLFLGINNIYADNTYTYSESVGSNTIKHYIKYSCNVSQKSLDISIGSTVLEAVNPNGYNNYQIMAKKLVLDNAITINNRTYNEIYYVETGGQRVYVEPLLIKNLTENNNCLEVDMEDVTKYTQLRGTGGIGLVYFSTSSVTKPTIASQYKVNCGQYMNWFKGPIEDYNNTYINIYKDQNGYFLAINDYRYVIGKNGGEGWCKVDDYNCINSNNQPYSEIKPYVCGYDYDTSKLLSGFTDFNEDIHNLIGKNLYLYDYENGVGYISKNNLTGWILRDTLKPYTGNSDIIGDKDLISCSYDFYGSFNKETYTISYSPKNNKFLVTGNGNMSSDPVRGLLADNMRKGLCQQKVYYCRNKTTYQDFFVDYIDYINSYTNTDIYDCFENESSTGEGVSTSISYYYSRLKNPLAIVAPEALNYEIYTNGQATTLNKIEANDYICSLEECKNNQFEYLKRGMLEITNFCTAVFSDNLNKDNESIVRDDCIKFKLFYNRLVKEGFLNDMTAGCDSISVDIQEKLSWILDLIKIAGPILALGLGTLDFIKAIASGDADKEMKTAFKRFSTRIIAAALLFVVPILLAFMMNVFLGNQDGYNEDNPFCNIVEWK